MDAAALGGDTRHAVKAVFAPIVNAENPRIVGIAGETGPIRTE
jgi:hypothetical protein